MSLNSQTLKQAKSFHFLLLIYHITLLLILLITAKKWTIDYLYQSFVLTKLRSFTYIFNIANGQINETQMLHYLHGR